MRFSLGEWVDVAAAASAAGLAGGAWIGETAVQAARADQDGQRRLLADLVRARAGAGGDLAVAIDVLVDVLVERLS